jgi:hypothetical protein
LPGPADDGKLIIDIRQFSETGDHCRVVVGQGEDTRVLPTAVPRKADDKRLGRIIIEEA